MKIYEIQTRADVEKWMEAQGRRVVRGYSDVGIAFMGASDFKLVDDNDASVKCEVATVEFQGFAFRGKTEAEACLRLAIAMSEYLAEHPGVTIRVRRDPTMTAVPNFDSATPNWVATTRILCCRELDEIEAERAKRAE